MVSLACHKNCKRGETASLALFKTENKCLMRQRACGMASLRTSHIAIGDCQSGAFFFLASSKIFRRARDRLKIMDCELAVNEASAEVFLNYGQSWAVCRHFQSSC